MRIVGQVEVVNRVLPTLSIAGKGRSRRTSLSLCKQLGTKNEVFMMYWTLASRNGTRYKVKNNIEYVFTRFVNEGRATIRFKTPSVDMYIRCDTVQLKSFLHVLKLALDPKVSVETLKLTDIPSTSIAALKVNTTMQVLRKQDYPYTSGFPRTLEVLKISDIEYTVCDTRILRLQNLKKLDLSNNLLTSIPEALGNLPRLGELLLQHNKLGTKNINDPSWNWINGKSLASSLHSLDLSNNEICFLPIQVCRLRYLISLKLDHNHLRQLPQGIGNLRELRYFTASNNMLYCLPGSIEQLKLLSMDVSHNSFRNILSLPNPLLGFLGVPQLLEIAAKFVIAKRIKYSARIIPRTLVQYLDYAVYCVCGKPCFETFARQYMPIRQLPCTQIVLGEEDGPMWFDAFFCSQNCLLFYNR